MRKLVVTALVCAVALVNSVSFCQSKTASEQATETTSATVLNQEARDKIVRQAQQGYYSLHAHGFQEFQCQVLVDWDTMYANLGADSVGRTQLLPILKKLQLHVAVGPTGASTVSYLSEVAPPTEEIAVRIRQSTGGIEQVLTGFFQTWSQFAIEPLFPEVGSDYKMEDLGDKFRMTQEDSTGEVIIEMNHDLVLDHMSVSTPKVKGNVNPVFTPSKNGLILTGYIGSDVKTEQIEVERLSVKISNQDVDGFQLPQVITAVVTNADPITVPVTFANCHAKRQ